MTRKVYEVACDRCARTSIYTASTPQDARAQAVQWDGWAWVKKGDAPIRDLCPTCRKEENV